MATKQEIQDVTDWFLDPKEGFWVTYPADLCESARNKGSRGMALKKMLLLNPDEEMRNSIIWTLREQIRHDRTAKKKGAEVYRWPHAVTYINQRRFDDTIEPYSDLPDTVDVRKPQGICKADDCGNFVHGPMYDHCQEHTLKVNEAPWLKRKRAEALRDLGLVAQEGESFHAYAMRCRKVFMEQKMGNFIGRYGR